MSGNGDFVTTRSIVTKSEGRINLRYWLYKLTESSVLVIMELGHPPALPNEDKRTGIAGIAANPGRTVAAKPPGLV